METVAAPVTGTAQQDAESRRLGAVVPARLRADIVVRRQFFKHQEYYVLKDALALTYFRLLPEEAYLLTLLDGKKTLREIAERFNARYPNETRTVAELVMFTNQLGAGGLLNISAGRFVEQASQTKPQQLLLFWAKLVSGLLFIKVPLLDPSPWLGGLAHAIRFVWTRWFVGLALAFFIWTAGLLLANAHLFTIRPADFFSASNLLLLWLATIIIKTLHEFGHATTCRHFGGEVHEMGFCLMCFTPCGYVDASDAWMMRRQRHKIFTTIAGVFTELILACIAAHFWLVLPDGVARTVAFNAMLVASVNTIVFNANPLMRFDGYYVVCDLLEIPNLRSKAMAFCSYHLQRIFLGYRNRNQESQFGDDANGRVFVVYAVFAYLYMISIIYGFTQIFGRVLEPVGLREFGLYIGFFVEGSFVALPFIKVIMDATKPGAHIVKTGSASRRVALFLVGLAAVILLSLVIPTRHHVRQQAVVVPDRSEAIASSVGGVVKEVHVKTGQWVNAGDLVVTLDNSEVTEEVRVAEAVREQAKVRFSSYGSSMQWAARQMGAQAAQEMELAEAGYRIAAARAAKLQLRASMAGYVLTPSVEQLVGSFAAPQMTVVRLGDTRQLRLLVALTEKDAQLVSEGARVTGRWVGSTRPLETHLDAISSQPAKPNDILYGMLSFYGGTVPSDALRSDARARSHFPVFLATAPLPNPEHAVPEGLRLRVTIEGKETTLGRKVWRWFMSLFDLRTSGLPG